MKIHPYPPALRASSFVISDSGHAMFLADRLDGSDKTSTKLMHKIQPTKNNRDCSNTLI